MSDTKDVPEELGRAINEQLSMLVPQDRVKFFRAASLNYCTECGWAAEVCSCKGKAKTLAQRNALIGIVATMACETRDWLPFQGPPGLPFASDNKHLEPRTR